MSRKKPDAEVQREECFAAVFRASYRRVLAYASRRSDDLSIAEDATAEVFTIAWRRFDELPAEPLPWLLGTARKVLANQRRTVRRRGAGPVVSLDQVEIPGARTGVADRVADKSALVAAFSALSERDREALALIAWDGLEVGEAAAVIGCTSARFSVRLHRARRRLLKELDAHGHSWVEARQLAERPGTADVL